MFQDIQNSRSGSLRPSWTIRDALSGKSNIWISDNAHLPHAESHNRYIIESDYIRVEKEINDLYALDEDGWDGEDAKAVLPETLETAKKIMRSAIHVLPGPDIAPGFDGSVGIEWESSVGDILIFIEIKQNGVIGILMEKDNEIYRNVSYKNFDDSIQEIFRLLSSQEWKRLERGDIGRVKE